MAIQNWFDGNLDGVINPKDIKTHFIKHGKTAIDYLTKEEFLEHSDNEFYTFCYESALIARSGWYAPQLKSKTPLADIFSRKPGSLFELLDTNRDNKISLNEFKKPFISMDKDRSLVIEQDEVIDWL